MNCHKDVSNLYQQYCGLSSLLNAANGQSTASGASGMSNGDFHEMMRNNLRAAIGSL